MYQANVKDMAYLHFTFILRKFMLERLLTFTHSHIVRPQLRAKETPKGLWLKVLGVKLCLKRDGTIRKEPLFVRWRQNQALSVILTWLQTKGKPPSYF